MPTFQEKGQEEAAEQAVLDADVIKMKKIRLFVSFLVLVETRSVLPKLIKFSGVLLKPVPCLIKSIHAWLPATTGVVTTHALSGATTEVQSEQGNSITLKVGEELEYQFHTSRHSAQSSARASPGRSALARLLAPPRPSRPRGTRRPRALLGPRVGGGRARR